MRRDDDLQASLLTPSTCVRPSAYIHCVGQGPNWPLARLLLQHTAVPSQTQRPNTQSFLAPPARPWLQVVGGHAKYPHAKQPSYVRGCRARHHTQLPACVWDGDVPRGPRGLRARAQKCTPQCVGRYCCYLYSTHTAATDNRDGIRTPQAQQAAVGVAHGH